MERILVIGLSKDRGGIENYLLNLYREIDRDRVQFDFITKENLGEEFDTVVRAFGAKVHVVGTFKKNVIKVTKKLNTVYKDNRYSKVYVNMSYTPTLIYALPGLWNGLETIFLHSHASNDNRIIKHKLGQALLLNLAFKRVRRVYMGCSERACLWMYGKKICDNNELKIINNAVSYERFKFSNERRTDIRLKYGITTEYVVGHIGRFSEEKNHNFILDAFNDLRLMREDVTLMLIGEGHLFSEIKNKAESMGIINKIVFVGAVSETAPYYSAMDCFWLPSKYEGFPMVAVEAETNGLKCVFSDSIDKAIDIFKTNTFLNTENTLKWAAITDAYLKPYSREVEKNDLINLGFEFEQQTKTVQNILTGC